MPAITFLFIFCAVLAFTETKNETAKRIDTSHEKRKREGERKQRDSKEKKQCGTLHLTVTSHFQHKIREFHPIQLNICCLIQFSPFQPNLYLFFYRIAVRTHGI